MAESQDGQERTEEPTSKRIQDARRKGQIARSRELNTTFMLLTGSIALLLIGDKMMEQFIELMSTALSFDRRAIFNPNMMFHSLGEALKTAFLLILPFLVITLIATFASSTALGGFVFSIEAMKPKPDKLNPIKGFKNLFGVQGLAELGKSVGKLVLVASVAVLLFSHLLDDLLRLGHQTPIQAMTNAGNILVWCFLALSVVLIVIAALDVPFQMWNHKRQLKMTKQEVKDERKDTEGKPEVKRRIKQMQYEMASRRMMEAVPEADVVITNPTHFAVALKYDDASMRAPRVVAKGKGLVAAQIRERALEHNVAIFSAPPLARALYFSTDLDQEIPAGLYFAVAQVLAYVFQLRTVSAYGGGSPSEPDDLPIPDEYYHPPVD